MIKFNLILTKTRSATKIGFYSHPCLRKLGLCQSISLCNLEDWLVHSSASTYADDSGTCVKGSIVEVIIPKPEEDGINVLKYMASNGLVANSCFLTKNQKQT